MENNACAAQRYEAICTGNGHQLCDDVLQALRRKEPAVTAQLHTVTGLLNLLRSGCAPFVRRVRLPKIAPEHREQLATFVVENAHVKELDLTGAALGNAGVLSILLALRSSSVSAISVLSVADVGLTKKGARDVAVLLASAKFNSLQSLNLARNCMDNAALVALEKAAVVAGVSVALGGNLCLVESLNAITHGVGATVAVFGGWRMMQRAVQQRAPWGVLVAVVLFVLSLFTMMTCSCLYHASHRRFELNKRLRKADHCGVFLLIAGTYTPFCVSYALDSVVGPVVLAAVWACAFVGLLFSTGLVKASTTVRALFALAMGWIGAVPAKFIVEQMEPGAVALVVGGGLAYSLGLIFYFLGRKIPMMHVIWHLAVMLGGSLHYIALWRYVLVAS